MGVPYVINSMPKKVTRKFQQNDIFMYEAVLFLNVGITFPAALSHFDFGKSKKYNINNSIVNKIKHNNVKITYKLLSRWPRSG